MGFPHGMAKPCSVVGTLESTAGAAPPHARMTSQTRGEHLPLAHRCAVLSLPGHTMRNVRAGFGEPWHAQRGYHIPGTLPLGEASSGAVH
jgi:hypothetical protein